MSYTLYNPVKYKTGVRGYWLADNGKLYKDNISLLYLNNDNIEDVKLDLFNQGELSVFYKDNLCAVIENAQGIRTYLYNQKLLKFKHISAGLFKALLKDYKGFTVYKNKGYYLIEIWQE